MQEVRSIRLFILSLIKQQGHLLPGCSPCQIKRMRAGVPATHFPRMTRASLSLPVRDEIVKKNDCFLSGSFKRKGSNGSYKWRGRRCDRAPNHL